VRDRAADECDLAHACELDVRNVLSATAQKPVVFLALEARADAELRHRRTPAGVAGLVAHRRRLGSSIGRHIGACIIV
jgi:hypothetical protein